MLEAGYTEKLIREVHHVYHTQINDLLLAALASALSDLTGASAHAVLLEGHGREDVFGNMDITETVGWFTSMYPLLLKAGSDVKDTVILTKESLRSIPNNGIDMEVLLVTQKESFQRSVSTISGSLIRKKVQERKPGISPGKTVGNLWVTKP